MIIGPYKPDGSTWGCDRDVCNGTFIDGQYVYVGSDKFPYVVGCWGPGPDPAFAPTCSNSGCGANSGSSSANSSSTPTNNIFLTNIDSRSGSRVDRENIPESLLDSDTGLFKDANMDDGAYARVFTASTLALTTAMATLF